MFIKILKIKFILILSLFLCASVHASILSNETFGNVDKYVVTSRDIFISYLIEAHTKVEIKIDPAIFNTKSKQFKRYLSKYILEYMIFLESKEFGLKLTDEKKIKFNTVKLGRNSSWKELKVEDTEHTRLKNRRKTVDQFIYFKERVNDLSVSEEDIRGYYDNNKDKFSGKTYEVYRSSIKAFLKNSYAKRQLQDWYEAMKEKYTVKIFL